MGAWDDLDFQRQNAVYHLVVSDDVERGLPVVGKHVYDLRDDTLYVCTDTSPDPTLYGGGTWTPVSGGGAYATWTPVLIQGTVTYDLFIDSAEMRDTGFEAIGGAVVAITGIVSGTYPAGATGASILLEGLPFTDAVTGVLAYCDAMFGFSGGTAKKRGYGIWAEPLTASPGFRFLEDGSAIGITDLLAVGDVIHLTNIRYRTA